MDNLKIVIIIPYRGLGDLIFHVPLLKGINSYFKSRIFILTNSSNKGKVLFKNLNFINKVEYLDFDREQTIKNSWKLYKKINSLNPDLCILTASSKRLIWPVAVSNSKKKIIFKKDNVRDISKYIFNQSLINFGYIKFIKRYDLNFPKKKINLNKIFINIDSHHNQNNWNEKYFIELIKKLQKNKKIHKIFVNFSPKNKKKFKVSLNNFKKSIKIIFTHNYNFNKIIDIINNCKFIIGNESGPNCIGAALNKKVLSLYNPLHTPYVSSKIINNKNIYFNTEKNSYHFIIKKIITLIK